MTRTVTAWADSNVPVVFATPATACRWARSGHWNIDEDRSGGGGYLDLAVELDDEVYALDPDQTSMPLPLLEALVLVFAVLVPVWITTARIGQDSGPILGIREAVEGCRHRGQACEC